MQLSYSQSNVLLALLKVGTAVVTRADGRLALGRLGALCEQVEKSSLELLEVIMYCLTIYVFFVADNTQLHLSCRFMN